MRKLNRTQNYFSKIQAFWTLINNQLKDTARPKSENLQPERFVCTEVTSVRPLLWHYSNNSQNHDDDDEGHQAKPTEDKEIANNKELYFQL